MEEKPYKCGIGKCQKRFKHDRQRKQHQARVHDVSFGEVKECKLPSCEETFYVPDCDDQVYCSVACSNRSRRSVVELTCDSPACEETFERKPSQVNDTNNYCSRSCYLDARRNWVTLRCENPACGEQFEVGESRAGERVHCSRSCHHEHRRIVAERSTSTGRDRHGPEPEPEPVGLAAAFREMVARLKPW